MRPSASQVATPMMFASTRRNSVLSRFASSALGANMSIARRLRPEADQSPLDGFRYRFRTARCPELFKQMRQVNLHGAFADVQRLADLAVRLAGRNESQHRHLPQCELHACHPRYELGG